MKLTVLTAAACLSPGEVLRFVDQKDLMKNDFVIVTGDVVANFGLQAALASHKQRRAANRHAIMTMVSAAASDCFQGCVVVSAGWRCNVKMPHCHLKSWSASIKQLYCKLSSSCTARYHVRANEGVYAAGDAERT